ncbi:Fe-S assembly protein IscX [Burkholderia multivorans]|jgi:feS assembly protein iscX|uniref:Fe-S cluster assembly protein IscX n=1 Tax=Burkholderia multivorans TaxID=87883 RepID=UPI000DAD479D|nr:Fe-S cluster assembly protein IscX [Burkholderia multivorans]RAF95117.1 Fe-S assembly protein IscX [Burkholderia multivorans]
MKWTDSREIAEYLADHHPNIDPHFLRFSDLRRLILNIPQFDDQPQHCGERVLEAVQAIWIEEVS